MKTSNNLIDNLFRIVRGLCDIIDGLVSVLSLGFISSDLSVWWLFKRIDYLANKKERSQ